MAIWNGLRNGQYYDNPDNPKTVSHPYCYRFVAYGTMTYRDQRLPACFFTYTGDQANSEKRLPLYAWAEERVTRTWSELA